MFDGLHDIDWSSMGHAYGTAEEIPALLTALRSPDADERAKALDRYYGAVHHQGDVYEATTASLPFLLELAGDDTTPDRAEVVRLLVSIAGTSVERCDNEYVGDADYAGAAAALRARAEAFVEWASDDDLRVRRAAVPALGLLIEDARWAMAVLRERLASESGVVERLLVLDAAAELVLRRPEAKDEATEWFATLAADEEAGSVTRLAAVVQRARCAPQDIDDEVVPTAIALLRESAGEAVPEETWADPSRPETPTAPTDGVPPQVVAAFEDLDRQGRVHAPTTGLLRAFHDALAGRVPERTALIEEQLRGPELGSRLDAIRMSADLMKGWRGDHTRLILLVAEQLDAPHPDVVAEAAAVLDACHVIAEPAREALAALVDSQRAAHGPDVWTTERRRLRRAHQEAVRALTRLGDLRAVPSLLVALDSGVDAWRAVEVAGAVPQGADRLVPRLCELLRGIDPRQEWVDMSAGALVTALVRLGDPAAVPTLVDMLARATRHGQGSAIARPVLKALGTFGTTAASALEAIRPLTGSSDGQVRTAAVAALWEIGRDPGEVLPLLRELLADDVWYSATGAADVLGRIGRPAAPALPRLRELLDHDYEWVRVHCAAAIWDIHGETESDTVLEVLLGAWRQNQATAGFVVACLDRMGRAARPALSSLRSELERPARDWLLGIEKDEQLQRAVRALLARLT
ncbi:HEAT repeat domain-containing protein [Streptomyces sp. NPDC057239]|uniref:HEAT repeat domain-containing protein n=1 Tax=Streptomyces sp. NPDC057239 TaxID=3346061 RepID=UPI003645D7B6